MLLTFSIIAMLFFCSFQTLFCKLYSDNYSGDENVSSSVFSVFQALGLAVLTFFLTAFKVHFSLFTILMGVLNSVMLFGFNASLVAAGKRGSYAFLNVMFLLGAIVIPMLHECIFLEESLKIYQFVAIFFVLVAMLLMNVENISLGGSKISYYIFCLLLFLTNGLYSTFLNVQSEYKASESQEMLIVAYCSLGIIAFTQMVIKQKKDTFKAFRMSKKAWLFIAIAIVSAGAGANLIMFILPHISSSVLFSIQTGGVLALSSIYSIVIFKEKLSTLKIIGLILAIVCMIILCI